MTTDRFAPATREDDRARTSSFPVRRFIPPAIHEIALSAPDVTPLERETIEKLRNRAGWWEGDANALRVLRSFVQKSSAQKNVQ